MANIPTDLVASVTLIDLSTAQGTQTFVQLVNAIIRALRDHETRITALE